MNEQTAGQTSGEAGSLDAGTAAAIASDTPSAPVAAAAREQTPTSSNVEPPKLVLEQAGAGETVRMDAPRIDIPGIDTPRIDTAKTDTVKNDTAKADSAKPDVPRAAGKRLIMWPSDRAGPEPDTNQSSAMFGKRRLAGLAAVVALAAIAGALGGAMATAGLGRLVAGDAAASGKQALEASIARIDADIAVLKASVEQTAKLGTTQFNKASDRLDKVEKAQAEPAAKLAKLSEAVDKLRVAPAASAAAAAAPAAVIVTPASAKDVTGSITPPAATPSAAPKAEVARLPTVEGWVLRDVANGAALIEGRRGMFEVYAGDPVPGLGHVDAIRRQDGHWVVVTSKGLIVAR